MKKWSKSVIRLFLVLLSIFYLIMFGFVCVSIHTTNRITIISQILEQQGFITADILKSVTPGQSLRNVTSPYQSGSRSTNDTPIALEYKHEERAKSYRNSSSDDLIKVELNSWSSREAHCDNNIVIYNKQLPTFYNLTVDPSLYKGVKTVVMNISAILRQREDKEFLKYQTGFFSIKCQERNVNKILDKAISSNNRAIHYTDWINSFPTKSNLTDAVAKVRNTYAVAMVRYEYANVYWNIIDLYDAYITCYVNNRTIQETDIFILDAHPKGHLDKLWSNSFRSILRLSDLNSRTMFTKLSWIFSRGCSSLLQKSKTQPPAWLSFRQEILRNNHIYSRPKNCNSVSNTTVALRVLLLWRRDYVAHARNPSGLIMRKVKNEAQIERHLKNKFPHFLIRGVQLDSLSIEEQLYLVANSDILVGMHGAGMSFSVFMPPGSAVIEIFPTYYQNKNWHMQYIALWTGHKYTEYRNKKVHLDNAKTGYTTLPVDTIQDLVNNSAIAICP